MSRTLKVHVGPRTGPPAHGEEIDRSMRIHHFRNFGEAVYLALRDACEISLDEIDASVDTLHLRKVPKRKLRSIAAKVRAIAEHHYPGLQPVEVTEIPEEG